MTLLDLLVDLILVNIDAWVEKWVIGFISFGSDERMSGLSLISWEYRLLTQ